MFSLKALCGVGACVAFSLVGPWLVVLNNRILSEKEFPFPILLSCVGVAASGALAHFLVDVVGVAEISKTSREAVGARYWRSAFPLGALYAASLTLGNATYLYLGVGLIQMLKSSTPALVLACQYACGIETPTHAVVASVVLITLGTAVTCAASATLQPSDSSEPKPSFSGFGVSLFFASSCFEALRLVGTQYLLTNVKLSVVEAQYYLSPPGTFCMVIVALFWEVPQALKTGALDVVVTEAHLFFASTILGMLVNYLGYFVIQTVGSLTLKTLGTLRNIGLVIYSVIMLGEVVIREEMIGYIVSLVGFVGYTYFSTFKNTLSPDERPERAEVADSPVAIQKQNASPQTIVSIDPSSEISPTAVGLPGRYLMVGDDDSDSEHHPLMQGQRD